MHNEVSNACVEFELSCYHRDPWSEFTLQATVIIDTPDKAVDSIQLHLNKV